MPPPNAAAPRNDDALVRRAAELSRFARHLLAADPGLLPAASLRTPFGADEMRADLAAAGAADEAALKRTLRDLRKRVMLRVIARDLGGLATLDEVVATVTALADIALAAAVSHLERWLAVEYGEPIGADSGRAQKLHVVAMGKLGGCELNVSSDIDLVFVYPEEGETRGKRPRSNHEFFIRFARRLIALLNEMTADGHVFRVDVRLRPLGADGPLACSFGMLENYFITQGREWERYAWIKARVVCGDRARELIELVRPFVFRRHLDYSAFESLRDLHREVQREVERRDIYDNIKLGPGGIREIEFMVQLHQLIRGGRDTALRELPTLTVLPLLAARNLLPRDAVQELTAAYVFLRNLEHRLQYLDDKQTQTLPGNADDQALIAAAMGCADYAALRAQLDHHRGNVTRQFESIFTASLEETHPLAGLWHPGDEEQHLDALRKLGYRDPQQALARIAALRDSGRVRQMPESSQARMQQLVPLVIETAARLSNPDATLERMLLLLESISRREAYLALLLQYPQTLERGAQLANASPWAAEHLTRYPILLDELLDTRALYAAPDWTQLKSLLHNQLEEASGDPERQMDVTRHFKHAQTMHLLAQDLAGELPLEKLSDHLSDLADLILSEALRLTWQGLRSRHCDEPRFAIVAYGKLGGKELGYASDLDLIFLYQDAAPEAPENYARLAPRLNNWLASLTAAGLLYETDLRLRPDGAGGLLVSPIEGFAEYQREHAWVWEHQALTRARYVAGAADIGRRFEEIRGTVLRQNRDLAQLRSEVVAMRDKMLAAHPNTSGRFDIKHDRGGLIDVEFIVQYLVLGYSHRHAELTGNIGNLALLKLAAKLGLIAESKASAAHDAYRRLRQLQHSLRLQGEKYARIEPGKLPREIAAVKELWNSVLGESGEIN
ncbi:MAG: bifunctional [glutamate--ammonia ligase]-adenylyl-L-tyrosine phosphorylase/[glutamate--ammonia-ligase] adenylyltransferase [Betaproteobacteria bacterium]|nr:bifunctional [glutamate--ammonia ligase]-adenylyl-L-tyrosine phosphorylase/[glutamate--ammonia-ligase] adenylyltransferase [Betaproteobacteria bacterium]